MREAWPLAAEFPPTSLPGSWSIPGPFGLHQVVDIAFLQPLPGRRLWQGPSTHRGQGQPEQQERLHAQPQIHAAPLGWPGGGEAEKSGVRRPRKALAAAPVG